MTTDNLATLVIVVMFLITVVGISGLLYVIVELLRETPSESDDEHNTKKGIDK